MNHCLEKKVAAVLPDTNEENAATFFFPPLRTNPRSSS